MFVEDIMTKNPACCTRDVSLQEVARLMVEHNCGAIPIVYAMESMRPTGIITDRDITCRAVAFGKNPLEMTANDCMSKSTIVVQLKTTLTQCAKVMENNQVRRVLVVDSGGKCCGIVAQADIALKANEQLKAEVVEGVSKK